MDAGPLYAYVDGDDRHHRACLEFLETHQDILVVPQLVIAEVTYFLSTRLGTRAESRFLDDLVHGNFLTEPVATRDWQRISELVWQYRDLPLGTVDASVVAAAERLGTIQIATLDRRHFSVVRPTHTAAFDLMPHALGG